MIAEGELHFRSLRVPGAGGLSAVYQPRFSDKATCPQVFVWKQIAYELGLGDLVGAANLIGWLCIVAGVRNLTTLAHGGISQSAAAQIVKRLVCTLGFLPHPGGLSYDQLFAA